MFPSRTAAAFGVEAQHPAFCGWDPLEAFVAEAAKRGIAVHAWLDGLMVGIDKSGGPVLRVHPDWCALPRCGAVAGVPVAQRATGYFWLDVTNPQVRAYLRGIIGEMIGRYGIAGINLDFMRLPQPHAEEGGDDYCFSRHARDSFARECGIDPLAIDRGAQPELWQAWTSWLTRCEDELVANVYREVKLARPDAVVSAAPEPGAEAEHIGRWAEHVDVVIPQAYHETAREVRQSVQEHQAKLPPDMPVYAGIYPMYIGLGAFEAVEQAVAAGDTTGGTVLFSLGHVSDDTLRALRLGPWRAPAVSPGVRPLEAAATTVAAALPGLSSAGDAAEAVGVGMRRLHARLREGCDCDAEEPDEWAAATIAAIERLAAQLDEAHAAGVVSSASAQQAARSLAEAKRFVYHWRIRQLKLRQLPQRRSLQP
ncbi:glycoside hydrolase family 10 protein [Paenibacillus cymbidii]|uniref:glycoside hydrolase family 10 protein n=1 Tax=Paenibacillus cymbidii TaxID=1639034 RepID=UPI001080020E|nr:family 10 glycosylhydrolase [Paenibacillus cymbidii]